jgi:membrane protease YdiL (CAAX protease family)
MGTQRAAWAVGWFTGLTFALTWLLWAPLWLDDLSDNKLLATMLPAIGMWIPGLAAFLITKKYLGESLRTTAIGQLGPKRYYLWAWLLPVVGTLASTALTVIFGLARFDSEFSQLQGMMKEAGKELPVPPVVIVVAQLGLSLTLAPVINILFALGEEIGWRGFLLPRLLKAGMRQWPALVLSGAVWGLWHAPLIARGHNYPDHPYFGVLLMTGFCILLGIIFGWLRLASGSVWPPALAHASLNAVAGMPVLLLTPFDTALGGMLTSLTGWVPLVALIAWLAWSRRLPVRLPETHVEDRPAFGQQPPS